MSPLHYKIRLRQLRKLRGLTQPALAALAGLSASTIYLIEAERRKPSLRTIERLASALDCDLLDLIESM